MLVVNYGRAEADNQPKFKNLKPSNLILKKKKCHPLSANPGNQHGRDL